jgi:hypothetical protein
VSAAELLQELNQMGVRLEVVGERVRYWPKDALTPDLLDRLRSHKFELLAMLREQTDRPNVNLADPNAVWQAVVNELKGDEMFTDELLQALCAATVAWGREQGST